MGIEKLEGWDKAMDEYNELPEEAREVLDEMLHEEVGRIANQAQVLSEGMTEEERTEEFTGYLVAAKDKHTKQVATPFPGFIGIEIDTAVPIYTADKPAHLEPAVYFLRDGENINEACLYGATFDFQELLDQINSGEIETEEAGDNTRVIKGEVPSIRGSIHRLEVEAGRALHYLEVLAFLAMLDAESEEQRRRIFSLGFVPKRTQEKEPLEVLPELATQSTAKVRNHLRPITKVYQNITDPELFNPETITKYDTAGRAEKRRGGEVLTAISLSYEGEGVNISKALSRTDTNIHDAIASLYAEGNTTFTTRQVFEALTGSTTSNPKHEKLAEIEKSLDKQRRTFVKLDFTQEMRGRKAYFEGERITEYKRESFMLDASKETIRTANGTEATGYVLHSAPILYMHAALAKQLVSYPQRLLTALQETGSNTNTNIAVRQYLLTRIEQAKNPKSRMSNRIRYSEVFKEAELGELTRTQKKRHVDHIKRCLDVLTKEGYIQGYKERKEGQEAVSVEIDL